MSLVFIIKKRLNGLLSGQGKTVYYPVPKTIGNVTIDTVINRIVAATSLTKGDVRNALDSLAEVVCDELRNGNSVDLAELGRLRVEVTPRFTDSLDEVSVKNSLKTPRIKFSPKRKMLDAAKKVKIVIEHP